jgi:hypothetical protein
MLRKLLEKKMGDEVLSFYVDLELKVMGLGGIDSERALEILPEQIAGRTRGILGRVEIMLHDER